jgi:hypothetical protein
MSKKGFTMIPNQLIIDEGLSKEAKHYLFICGIYRQILEY